MRFLLATGAAMAALSGAASAQSGFVDVQRASIDYDTGDSNATAISGAVSMPLRGLLDFQIDGQALSAQGADDTRFGGTAHLVGRNQGWMLGAFAGAVDEDEVSTYALGAEGALYFKRWTLAGALAYRDSDDTEVTGVVFRGEGRYFFSRDLRVDALLGFDDLDTPFGDSEAITFGVGGEFRFSQTPVSVFGALTRSEADLALFDADTFRLGLRWNFDQDLAQRDEAGASLVSVPGLLSGF